MQDLLPFAKGLVMAVNPTESFSGIPTEDTLDEIAQLVAECDFKNIGNAEHRAVVVDLAIKAEQSGALQDMALWFRVSKVWEGN